MLHSKDDLNEMETEVSEHKVQEIKPNKESINQSSDSVDICSSTQCLEDAVEESKVRSGKHYKYNKAPKITKRERKKLGPKDEGRAVAKHIRMSNRKVALILDLVRNKPVEEAYGILKLTNRIAADVVYKLVHSAAANAVNNNLLDKDRLYIAEAYANQGPTLKRIMPRAKGRAYRIRKRSSHITVVVKEKAIM